MLLSTLSKTVIDVKDRHSRERVLNSQSKSEFQDFSHFWEGYCSLNAQFTGSLTVPIARPRSIEQLLEREGGLEDTGKRLEVHISGVMWKGLDILTELYKQESVRLVPSSHNSFCDLTACGIKGKNQWKGYLRHKDRELRALRCQRKNKAHKGWKSNWPLYFERNSSKGHKFLLLYAAKLFSQTRKNFTAGTYGL